MGCNCNKGAAAVTASVQKYTIAGDPDNRQYLTKREALDAKVARGLTGDVVPVQ